jgi:hypothetical protein
MGRKVDGDMHIVPPNKQPVERWYPGAPASPPGSLDELLWCIKNVHKTKGPAAEMRATGSHWAMSEASVTPGDMIETATPVHEGGSDQTKPRLNRVLYDVIPDCLTDEARRFFFYGQNVPVFNPNLLVDPTKVYLVHVEAGMRVHELYSYIDRRQRAVCTREHGVQGLAGDRGDAAAAQLFRPVGRRDHGRGGRGRPSLAWPRRGRMAAMLQPVPSTIWSWPCI